MLKDELRATFLFEALSDGQLNRLMELGREVTFPTDIVLFVEGQPADLLWVLLDGKVELSRQVGGQRIVMDTMSRPGEYAGGIRAFAASDTSAGYRATGTTALPSRFFQLSSEALGRLLDELLPMAKHLLDGYVHTLEAIEASVRERGHLIALGTMAAGLTHELNNPAAAARSASGDLRDVMDRLVAQVCSVELDWNSDPIEGCRAFVRCGEARLYGDLGEGYFECAVDEDGIVHGEDAEPTSAGQGDPRMTIDRASAEITVSDDAPGWSVTLSIPALREAALEAD